MRVFHSEIDAHLLARFIVDTIKFQVEIDERFVDLKGLTEITRTFIVDAVVAKVKVRQDLRLEEVLGDFTGARLSNLVMRQIELSDSLV